MSTVAWGQLYSGDRYTLSYNFSIREFDSFEFIFMTIHQNNTDELDMCFSIYTHN